MDVKIMIANSLAIAFAYSFIAFQFMRPNRLAKLTCYLIIFGVELVFHFYHEENPVTSTMISGLVHILIFFAISCFVYAKQKIILKAVNISLSIVLILTLYVHFISRVLYSAFPNYFTLNNLNYNVVMQVCVFIFALTLVKYKNYFFRQSSDKKLMLFNLSFKVIFFIVMMIVLPFLMLNENKSIYHISQYTFTANIIISFFYAKYNTKLMTELEINNRKSAVALTKRYVEADNINKRFDEIVRFKHYCTKVYRSIVGYIDENDMPGLKAFYTESIAPMNEQLHKEIGEYQQIKHIKIELIKARMLELINTVSQIPNVSLYIHVENVIDKVAMKDMDLFAVLNIYIDNAVEETMTQEKGEILIQMSQEYDRYIFSINNSLKGYQSTLKPENTHMGLEIIKKVKVDYSNLLIRTQVEYGRYIQLLEVFNE